MADHLHHADLSARLVDETVELGPLRVQLGEVAFQFAHLVGERLGPFAERRQVGGLGSGRGDTTSTARAEAPGRGKCRYVRISYPFRRRASCRIETLGPSGKIGQVADDRGVLVARIGILTGGGDCPGLNAVIRAVVRKGVNQYGHAIVGYRDGWRGVLENHVMHLTPENTSGILHRGGTILGSSRTNPFKEEGGVERVKENLASEQIDALIAIGGEDTLGVADKLTAEGDQRRRRSQDDRQRPQRHRLHLRVQHRRADLHRRDRPAPHDRRVAQPRDRPRGDGPARGMDRHATRGSPGGPTRSSSRSGPSTSTRCASTSRHRHKHGPARSRSSSSPRARRRSRARRASQEEETDAFGHVRSVGSA